MIKKIVIALILTTAASTAVYAQSRGGWTEFSGAVAQRESSGNQRIVNPYGYAGLYQMGTAALIDAGYIKAGTPSKSNNSMNDASVWTGKNGITSVSQYLDSRDAQQNAWETYQARNWQTMQSVGATAYSGQTMADGTVITDSGLIFASQFGVGKLQAYLKNGGTCVEGKGTATNDGNGVCVSEYMRKGAGYDVSSFTRKAENLSNFKPQSSTDTGNADGRNAAQQVAATGAADTRYDVGCWPCQLMAPIAQALDQVAARGDDFAARYGVVISSIIGAFAMLWLLGAAQLGLLGSWRRIAAVIAGVVVVTTLLTSRGWLWSEVGQPIFAAVVAVGGEIAAPGGTCTASAGTSGGSATWRVDDPASYDIARDIQRGDTLGGSGAAQAGAAGSNGGAGSAGSGALTAIVPAAKCSIESAIATPNKILSNLWWAVDQKVASTAWINMPNLPTIIQFGGFGIVYLAFTGLLAWIFIISLAEAAIGIALLPVCLPAALLSRSRPMVWMCAKMIASAAVTLAIVGVVSAISSAAISQALTASRIEASDAGLQAVLRQGALPIGAWITAVGALLVGSLLAYRARVWGDGLTAWLGIPSPAAGGLGQQAIAIGRQSVATSYHAARVAGVGIGAATRMIGGAGRLT